MRPTILGWLTFFGGLALMLAIDWRLRMRDGDIRDGGLPDLFAIVTVASLALVSTILLWHGTARLDSYLMRFTVLGIELGIGAFLYFIIALWYVVDHGIDTL